MNKKQRGEVTVAMLVAIIAAHWLAAGILLPSPSPDPIPAPTTKW